jgi:hypothetical protein|tara:strand:- start:617 stop:1924 length:1308 start_codon:yes stop_codon:yes gene_type:complete
MTAEVAILNKTAIALAADSAVTISSGSDQQKTYDSADKLFELSNHDPIAVMVNGDMNFAQTPLPVLVKLFRDRCAQYDSVENAASEFLDFLSDHGAAAPVSVRESLLEIAIRPWFERIKERFEETFTHKILSPEPKVERTQEWFAQAREDSLSEQIRVVETGLSKLPDANFVGGGDSVDGDLFREVFSRVTNEMFPDLNDEQRMALARVADLLFKKPLGPTNTGIIIAGYGRDEVFPTLIHYEVFGVIGTGLKYLRREKIDIDRDGERARVLPFAQKEMVERFLYGLDLGIRRSIEDFCRQSVPRIREKLLEQIELSEADSEKLNREAEVAEAAFLAGLVEESFDLIRSESELEIEGMVEFMPKPELARMAEALVDLTSIKRRVSRGYETVGGPIDVAVISKAEGFVWVKRKHYFPAELNQRFFERKKLKGLKGE